MLHVRSWDVNPVSHVVFQFDMSRRGGWRCSRLIRLQSSKAPSLTPSLTPSLVFSLCSLKPSNRQHGSVKKWRTGHWTSPPHPNIQINLSQVLRFSLPLSGPHPLTPLISLSSETNVSTRHSDILRLRVQISSLTRAESTEEGNLSHVQNESGLLPLSFIKCALKKVWSNKKKSCSYHMRWLRSKANTPTGVCTKTDDYRTRGLASTT